MVQRDLERAGIPQETDEELADFPAAGRHSQITGLVRSGASSMEAEELARHSDIRRTTKSTHIRMEDGAEALGNLPVPKTFAPVELSERCRISGGAPIQQLSAAGTRGDENEAFENDKTPPGEGVLSSIDAASQELAFGVSSGGGGKQVFEIVSFHNPFRDIWFWRDLDRPAERYSTQNDPRKAPISYQGLEAPGIQPASRDN